MITFYRMPKFKSRLVWFSAQHAPERELIAVLRARVRARGGPRDPQRPQSAIRLLDLHAQNQATANRWTDSGIHSVITHSKGHHMNTYKFQIGKYKYHPVTFPKTAYLLWLLSQDALRQKYPDMSRAVVAELRRRLNDPEAVRLLVPDDGSDLV